MTQETRDILYNKKPEELNQYDVGYINQLINKKFAGFNFWLIMISSPLISLIFSLILAYNQVVTNGLLPFMVGLGGFLGLFLGTMFYSLSPSLRSLGLSRKEWKELIKSGRLKELDKIVDLYNNSHKSKLDELNENKIEIEDQLEEIEQIKHTLLTKLESIKQKEQTITGNQETPIETEKDAEKLLKKEESLLLRRLERVKKEQQMLSENVTENTKNELTNKAEKNIEHMEESFKVN